MKITINHNGFHGYRSSTINVSGAPGQRVELTCSQIKKLDRAACGSKDCKCGETLLVACDQDFAEALWYITVPEGNEINVRGRYPQG